MRGLPDQKAAGVVPEPIPIEEPEGIGGPPGGASLPLLPVQVPGRNLVLTQRRVSVQPPGRDQVHLTERTRIHHFLGFEKQLRTAALLAALHDPFGAADRGDHVEAFVDRVRHRLLDVHILAGFHRVDGHPGVPVIGRRDDHRIERLILQHLPVVAVLLRARGGEFEAGGQVGPVDIADGGDLGANLFELLHQVSAPAPGSDDSGADAVTGAQGVAGDRGSDQKIATLHECSLAGC